MQLISPARNGIGKKYLRGVTMKRNRIIFIIVFVFTLLFAGCNNKTEPIFTQESSPPRTQPDENLFTGIANSITYEDADYFVKRDNLANTMAILTGTANNTLLVSGAIGAYKYYTTPDETRNLLPWYYRPWFWVICLALVAFAYIPSIPANIFNLPPTISKFIELCNKKIGLLLASPILFDTCISLVKQLAETASSVITVDKQYVYASSSIIPWEGLSGAAQVFWFIAIVPMLFFVFFAMWLLNYGFDVLIFLCPFGWIDLLLKIARGIFFVLLLVTAIYFPQLVYVLIIPVMVISILLFGWSVRRAIMGLVFLKDFIIRKKEVSVDENGILVFSGSNKGIKTKSIGKLTEKDGDLFFSYRRFFLFRNTVTIDRSEMVLRKGFLYSTIHNRGIAVFALPPRYQKVAEEVTAYLGADRMEESSLKKGLKGIMEWFKRLTKQINTEPASA